MAWVQDDTHDDRVGILLDRAGIGKSVVLGDVLLALDAAGITSLAIKADQQLARVDSADALQAALRLPESVERVIGRLAALGPVVVLIDQVDALSLSLARDQRTLDVVLDMVARLRLIPGVRILLSCRSFDRNGDPRLRAVEAKREFFLEELDDGEIGMVLHSVGIDMEDLSPATLKLLRVPLHADLFVRAIEDGGSRRRDPQVYPGDYEPSGSLFTPLDQRAAAARIGCPADSRAIRRLESDDGSDVSRAADLRPPNNVCLRRDELP